ncbi:MAG: cytochrome c [Magnetococcales bacterium]|nr:cytochrome c [Magnetococcales bacterium]
MTIKYLSAIPIVLLLLLASIATVTAAEQSGSPRLRHFQKQPPADYLGRYNPLTADQEQQTIGQRLFDQHCTRCHGFGGVGKGLDGDQLTMEPAELIRAAQHVFPSDRNGYLYWTIAEGGEPIGSPMPPFKEVLDSKQIWQIILYINTINYF